MDSEINQKRSAEVSTFQTEDFLSTIDGIPLPPAIKKSLYNSIGRLITGLVDLPIAYLEAKAQKIKSEADALSLITKKVSQAAAFQAEKDQFLIDRTINYFSSKLLREQINREGVVRKAIDELKADLPKKDSDKEIDPDWLEMFSRVAETKSNEEVQLFLAKILAGEIRNPGAFSPKTIQTLSLLDQNTAQIFQSFCNISFEVPQFDDSFCVVICDPFGNPGNNALIPVGLTYSALAQLQDAGLIQHDLTAWREIPVLIFAMPVKIGDKIFSFKPNMMDLISSLSHAQQKQIEGIKMIKVNSINFTAVGHELRRVLHLSHNDIYNAKFEEWLTPKLNTDFLKADNV